MNLGKLSALDVGMFLTSIGLGFEIFSSLTSSPWTCENFGADEKRAKSAKEYVILGVVFNEAIGLGASLLTDSYWPLLGVTCISTMFYLVYMRALERGKQAGNTGWKNGPSSNGTSTSSESGPSTTGQLQFL